MRYNDRVAFRLSKTQRVLIEQMAQDKKISVGKLLRELTNIKYGD